ncbi:hypothetical protein MMC28_006052 [Mycoblastus sanguinarius]|nr:hypothetical protein [Mycoblastus sanguinarius]
MDQDFLRFRQQHRTVPLDPWRSPLLEEPRIDEESLETEHDIWKDPPQLIPQPATPSGGETTPRPMQSPSLTGTDTPRALRSPPVPVSTTSSPVQHPTTSQPQVPRPAQSTETQSPPQQQQPHLKILRGPTAMRQEFVPGVHWESSRLSRRETALKREEYRREHGL